MSSWSHPGAYSGAVVRLKWENICPGPGTQLHKWMSGSPRACMHRAYSCKGPGLYCKSMWHVHVLLVAAWFIPAVVYSWAITWSPWLPLTTRRPLLCPHYPHGNVRAPCRTQEPKHLSTCDNAVVQVFHPALLCQFPHPRYRDFSSTIPQPGRQLILQMRSREPHTECECVCPLRPAQQSPGGNTQWKFTSTWWARDSSTPVLTQERSTEDPST